MDKNLTIFKQKDELYVLKAPSSKDELVKIVPLLMLIEVGTLRFTSMYSFTLLRSKQQPVKTNHISHSFVLFCSRNRFLDHLLKKFLKVLYKGPLQATLGTKLIVFGKMVNILDSQITTIYAN